LRKAGPADYTDVSEIRAEINSIILQVYYLLEKKILPLQ
jgi:hypothetical protein